MTYSESSFSLSKATLDDVYSIYDACKSYYEESSNGTDLVPDEQSALETLSIACGYPEDYVTFFITENGIKICGVVIVCAGKSWFKGREADIDFLYVLPEYRGKGVSRLLVEAAVSWAMDAEDINILYCGCHSRFEDGGKNDKMFTNLFKKFGFEVTGTNLHLLIGKK